MSKSRSTAYHELRILASGAWRATHGDLCTVCQNELGDDVDKITYEFKVHPDRGGSISHLNVDWMHTRCCISYQRNMQL